MLGTPSPPHVVVLGGLKRSARGSILSERRRRHDNRYHVFDARPANAGDQAGATLKRDIIPRPVRGDRQTIAESDQEIDVREAS